MSSCETERERIVQEIPCTCRVEYLACIDSVPLVKLHMYNIEVDGQLSCCSCRSACKFQ